MSAVTGKGPHPRDDARKQNHQRWAGFVTAHGQFHMAADTRLREYRARLAHSEHPAVLLSR